MKAFLTGVEIVPGSARHIPHLPRLDPAIFIGKSEISTAFHTPVKVGMVDQPYFFPVRTVNTAVTATAYKKNTVT
jgi:hypothetical protein